MLKNTGVFTDQCFYIRCYIVRNFVLVCGTNSRSWSIYHLSKLSIYT